MKHYNKLIFLVCLIFASMAFTISSSAHTTSISVQHDPTYTGWNIYNTNEKHHSNFTTAITVSKGNFTNADFGSYITSAVTSWNGSTFDGKDLLNMSESSNGYVKFCRKTLDEMKAVNKESTWAFVNRKGATADSNGHYTTTAGNVEIWVNWDDVLCNKTATCKTHVALHELGHVIGLKDIPSSVSPNAYLMCNEFGANYSVPSAITAADKKGAAVILGQHTAHSFRYKSLSSTQHIYACTKCGGYTEINNHSFGEWVDYGQWQQVRHCTYCGYAQYKDK